MRIVLWLIAIVCMTPRAAWADGASEVATALQYAYRAAQADTIKDVHANLHRAMNCVVGPKDSLFDSSIPNPCAKLGKGAIADTADPAKRKHLKDAVDMAAMALAGTDLEKAVMLATGAAGELRASQESVKNASHKP